MKVGRRLQFATLCVSLALVHWVVYLGLVRSLVWTGVEGRPRSSALTVPLQVLGTPLMHVLALGPPSVTPWKQFGWAGDGLVMFLAALNSSLWGIAIAWIVGRSLFRKHSVEI